MGLKLYIRSTDELDANHNIPITTATNVPNQGLFWFIIDELISFHDPVDIDNFMEFGYMNHKDTWRHIKSDYTVNGREVSYDYFPRGRVIINPEFTDDGDFKSYTCYVYGDKCILHNKEIQDLIETEFRLYLGNCNVYYEDHLSLDDTHYSCHNCR